MSATEPQVRTPAVAGTFYPADPGELRDHVRALLTAADPSPVVEHVQALVVPHAGFSYSGAVAAAGYRVLSDAQLDAVRRVVIVGPAHTVAFAGIALPAADALTTPLGAVPVDRALRDRLAAVDGVIVDDRPHEREHSIEVQLPFLQVLLRSDWTVLPVVVGRSTPDLVQRVLAAATDSGRAADVLVVVSTDLSHYERDAVARAHDLRTAGAIEQGADAAIDATDACGATALAAVLSEARERRRAISRIALATSSDGGGSRDRVVGYGAFAVGGSHTAGRHARRSTAVTGSAPVAPALDSTARAQVLDVVERTLRRALTPSDARAAESTSALAAPLRAPGASVVSLSRHDRTWGPVGSVHAERLLGDDVAQRTLDAAFADPTVGALRPGDLVDLSIVVTVVGPLTPVPVDDAASLASHVHPLLDGLVVESRHRRAHLLPAAWATHREPAAFVAALWDAAGLEPGWWSPDVRVWRFAAVELTRHLDGRLAGIR